ncbi:glycoside hydrolase family 25 protein [Dietzia sp. UBA5065]|uniref:glycoside hydrolase family 25 protein n=1 Tax=Dietzia sp. UBA5065 TaxID=1946422 RepID=UPI0025C52D4E|nr:glycoside hydrolase family 25 protein [Dietzia sp. UBA5065]HMT50495.1 glycoside hydrolase family 25 protein [Dietzia sp.]
MPSAEPPVRRAPIPRLLVALASAATLSIGLLVVVLSPRADAVVPPSAAFDGLARGLDSSSWQHPHGAPVDWHAAAASGQTYAFIKATEGSGPANRHYEADVHAARAAGMTVGSYHMARPAMDPVMQAHAFAARLQSVGGDQLPPVLDLETDEGRNPGELMEWTRVFLDTLTHLTGRTPIVYTYRYFWIDRMANTTQFAEYPLWLAEYGVPEPTLPVIGGWDRWLFWQKSETGEVPGFAGPVDLNIFAGSREDLGAWTGPVSPAPPPAPVPEALPAPDALPAPGALPEPAPAPAPAPEGVHPPENIPVPGEPIDRLPPEVR